MQTQYVPRRMPWILWAAFALMAASASAREKSDVIILKNGDHISGEIRTLDQGMLTLKTDSMGTVQIKWEDIERVTSKFTFRIEDSGGRLYYGTLGSAPETRSVQIVGIDSTEQLAHLSVVRINQFDEGIWDRFSASLSLGFSFTKANSATQYNVASDVTYRGSRWEGTASYDSLLSRYQGATQADRWSGKFGGRYSLGERWFTFSSVTLEHNLELSLDRRTSLMGGVGRYLIQTNRANLKLGGGINYARENYVSVPGRNNLEGAIVTSGHFFKLYSPKIDMYANFLTIPSFSDAGRIRLELDSGVKFEMFFKDFFWNVSFYDSFDSRPPQEDPIKNDYGIVTGISWSFRK